MDGRFSEPSRDRVEQQQARGCRQWRWTLGLMLSWSGFQTDIATLAWNGPRRQGQPSLFQGDDCSWHGPGGPVSQSRHLSTSSSQLHGVHGPSKVGGRSGRSVTHGPFCFFSPRSKTSKRKFGCSSSPDLFPFLLSTPPFDSAAHHIATRQIRASCSVSTVPTLMNSAIMGAEKDGFPAVPLRTAQTLNSTVVWAVSEAPNISLPFQGSPTGWVEAHYRLSRPAVHKQHLRAQQTNERPERG